ncbi:energy-coupling factor transporter transmembrane component T family protein [Sanguibacter antarcticus]|uniref:Biotin transport system permease protein n=1 Tax=Sanguibacter antarcticus TaxID=372484 RepID=A0A2A9E581_9MICO|nr:energy-coupling factor transporter transmembrane protein EcfT [Sanguibacter antarcticus]PFG33382.1 biotin transport system permease protein [Sanguibacter antarcticus]
MSERRRRPSRPPWSGPLGLYSPHATWLHALSPGDKLGAVAAASIALTFVHDPRLAVGALTVSLLVLASARVPARATVRALAPIMIAAVGIGLYQWWSQGWEMAVVTSGTLATLVVLATVVTATTRTDRMLDALVRLAGPLRRIGLDPEVLALAVALMLRTIPALIELVGEVRDAARARGLDRDPRALLVPFALRTVARAQATGDALTARGILD